MVDNTFWVFRVKETGEYLKHTNRYSEYLFSYMVTNKLGLAKKYSTKSKALTAVDLDRMNKTFTVTIELIKMEGVEIND